jgi:uroporphyrinogen-III synthase
MPAETSNRFQGVRVISFESRRAVEMERLIRNYGGDPLVAPSMREVPLEQNERALAFAADLLDGRFDMVLFLTGVGTRALGKVVETRYEFGKFLDALRRVKIIARGPKPIAVLREWDVPIHIRVPEPNTWREILAELEPLPAGKRIAVQEYGKSNTELLEALRTGGLLVTAVPVYQWDLPEDIAPLRAAIQTICGGQAAAALFTTSIQVDHVLKVAADMGCEDQFRTRLNGMMIASIGPVASEALREHGLHVDLEPSHPKMGFLVKEAAEQSAAILAAKG